MSLPATKRLQYLSWGVLVAIAALVLVVSMPGCVSLEAPKTFKERMAYGYASVAASRNTAAGLLERKRLTREEAVQIQATADQARTALDLARASAGKGDVSTAQKQLDLALAVLTALEARLKEAQ